MLHRTLQIQFTATYQSLLALCFHPASAWLKCSGRHLTAFQSGYWQPAVPWWTEPHTECRWSWSHPVGWHTASCQHLPRLHSQNQPVPVPHNSGQHGHYVWDLNQNHKSPMRIWFINPSDKSKLPEIWFNSTNHHTTDIWWNIYTALWNVTVWT